MMPSSPAHPAAAHQHANADSDEHERPKPPYTVEDQHVYEALGIFAVVHGPDPGNESQQRGQAGISEPGYRWSTRRHGGSTGRWHGAAQLRGQTFLAIDNATDVSRAAAAQWFPTRTAECDCGNVGMIGAVHAILLFSRA